MDFKENIANTLNKVKASNELDKKIFDSTISFLIWFLSNTFTVP